MNLCKKSSFSTAVLSFLCSGTLLFLPSCGDVSEENLAAAQSFLSLLENSDCFETEDEGYVSETSTETEEESEAAALDECVAELQAAYDVDGDGAITTTEEIAAVNTDIEERQALKIAEWTADGLTEEEGRARDKKRRKLMREIALEACLADHDADEDGELSKEEHKACHDARKEDRAEIRKDLRCSSDEEGECGPIAKGKLKELRDEKLKNRDDFLDTNAPDGEIPEDRDDLREAFKDIRERRNTDRESRVEENDEKEESGRSARKKRGKIKKQ